MISIMKTVKNSWRPPAFEIDLLLLSSSQRRTARSITQAVIAGVRRGSPLSLSSSTTLVGSDHCAYDRLDCLPQEHQLADPRFIFCAEVF